MTWHKHHNSVSGLPRPIAVLHDFRSLHTFVFWLFLSVTVHAGLMTPPFL